MTISAEDSLWQFVLGTGEVSNIVELTERFSDAFRSQGYDWFFYLKLGQRSEPGSGKWRAAAHNCPADWVGRYFEREYEVCDPLLTYGSDYRSGFSWREFRKDRSLTRQELKVLNERAEAGLRGGFTVPIHGPASEVALVSYARRDSEPATHQQEDMLALAAFHFHGKYESFGTGRPKKRASAPLTKREREVLTWCSVGKSNGVIAQVLGIAESSVKFHLSNTYAKLGVSTRPQAIVIAIRQGLIKP